MTHTCRVCDATVEAVVAVDGVGYCPKHGRIATWLDRDLLASRVTKPRPTDRTDEYGNPFVRVVEDTNGPVPLEELQAIISGIDRKQTLAYWLQIECQHLDRGPRDRVVDLLEARRDRLDDIGERPDRLDVGAADRSDAPEKVFVIRDVVDYDPETGEKEYRVRKRIEPGSEEPEDVVQYHEDCGTPVEDRDDVARYGLWCPECEQVTKSVVEEPPAEVSA